MIRFVFSLVAMTMLLGPVAFAQAQWEKVATALGKSGSEMPGEVYRVALPRTDLNVTVDGVDIKPGFALGGWVAFKSMGSSSTVMGDLVLTETEINPVMSKLFQEGLTVTAVHNHLLRAQPATFYMHISGQGDPEKLAAAVRAALAESKTPLTAASATAQPAIDLDIVKLNDILGARGNPNGGVLGYGIPRADPVTDEGMIVPPAMGAAIGINFQPVGGGRAAITGDFVSDVWHVLGLRVERDNFTISFNGKALFTAKDSTFANAGKVALWTKADSATYFHSLKITTLA